MDILFMIYFQFALKVILIIELNDSLKIDQIKSIYIKKEKSKTYFPC